MTTLAVSGTAARPRSRIRIPDERRFLTRRYIAEALDDGLVDVAVASGDAGALLRVALLEQAAGRFSAALEHARAASAQSDDPEVRELAATIALVDAFWRGDFARVPLPDPGRDAEAGTLLRLVAAAQHLSALDTASGENWPQMEELLERITHGADEWLRGVRGVAALVEGMPTATQALLCVFNTHRSPWAVSFLERLRKAVDRHGVVAWRPWLDGVRGYALATTGDFQAAREALRKDLMALLDDGETSAYMVLMVAQLFTLASIRGGAPVLEATDIMRRLTEGSWRTMGATVRHTAAAWVAHGLAAQRQLAAARAVLATFGPVADQALQHPQRILGYELEFNEVVIDGDQARAMQLLQTVEGLFASPMRQAALARMRVLLGEDADPAIPAIATGVAADLVYAHWVRLISAVRSGDRGASLRALAAFDPYAARTGATALRVQAVQLFWRAGNTSAITARQWEVARLAASGLTNGEIGQRLFLSSRTVETHLRRALAGLGLSRRSQLASVLFTPPRTTRPRAPLSTRQGQVAALIAAGCTNPEIAATLGLSEKTVEQHITAIRAAVGATNRTEIASAFLRAEV